MTEKKFETVFDGIDELVTDGRLNEFNYKQVCDYINLKFIEME